jgi:hypothetical protein
MNYADIVVGQEYTLTDKRRVGQALDIGNLTVGNRYLIVEKVAPEGVKIRNDGGRLVILKAFRFQRPFVPAENPWLLGELFNPPVAAAWEPQVGDLVRVKGGPKRMVDGVNWVAEMDVFKGLVARIKHLDGKGKFHLDIIGAQWYTFVTEWLEPAVAAPVKLEWKVGAKIRFKDKDVQYFANTPERNNPGFTASMQRLFGKVLTVKTDPEVRGDEWFRIEECPDQYHYCKEWFDLVEEGEQPVVPKKAQPKFKEGDVIVIQKGGKWIKEMDETIGNVAMIAALVNGLFECDNGFSYSAEALSLANKEERKLAIGALLKQAQAKALKEIKPKAGGVSTFSMFRWEDGEVVDRNYAATICHAALGYDLHEEIVGVTDYLFTYKTQVKAEQHDDYKDYVDYITTRSPWNIVYKRTSLARGLKEGFHLKVDVPGKIIGAACVSLRMGKEFASTRLPIFTMCTKAGYEEAVAYIAMQAFIKEGEKIKQSVGTGAHTVLDPYTEIGSLVSLMRYGYDEKSMAEEKYSKRQGYRGFTKQINNQIDYLKDTTSLQSLAVKTAPGEKKGSGFEAYRVWEEKDVYAFCDALVELFNKLDVM